MPNDEPITLSSWPNAILHLDGDAFFASCEQSIHPELKGKPVITGKERNIVASMSYEAKALGVKRAVSLWEVKKICPNAIILPSDYETYSLISKRMFGIMRRFSPEVEESSIDEGYADLAGLRRLYRTGYEEIAKMIQSAIERELDIPISVGLGATKTIAKIAAKYKKPRGFTAVPCYKLHEFYKNIPVIDVCGIGLNTTALLRKKGVATILEYVRKPEYWVKQLLGKIGIELWHELRGEMVYKLNTEQKLSYDSISKSKTFTPPSNDFNYVQAQLLRNTESAFIKMRRYHLRTNRIIVFIKRQDFHSSAVQSDLNRPTICPFETFSLIEKILKEMFRPGTFYRATGIVLLNLEVDGGLQFELFHDPLKMIKMEQIAYTIDEINASFGKHTIHGGTGLHLGLNARKNRFSSEREVLPGRKTDLLSGETFRQRLEIPIWQVKV